MSEALIFSIILLIVSAYGVLSVFFNWEWSKKDYAKKTPYNLFDKILSTALLLVSICLLIFIIIKGY